MFLTHTHKSTSGRELVWRLTPTFITAHTHMALRQTMLLSCSEELERDPGNSFCWLKCLRMIIQSSVKHCPVLQGKLCLRNDSFLMNYPARSPHSQSTFALLSTCHGEQQLQHGSPAAEMPSQRWMLRGPFSPSRVAAGAHGASSFPQALSASSPRTPAPYQPRVEALSIQSAMLTVCPQPSARLRTSVCSLPSLLREFIHHSCPEDRVVAKKPIYLTFQNLFVLASSLLEMPFCASLGRQSLPFQRDSGKEDTNNSEGGLHSP